MLGLVATWVLRLASVFQARSKSLARPLLWSLSLLGCSWANAAPLDLGQALAGLESHPRLGLSAEIAERLPRRQTLYLDCHRLAFSDSQVSDPERDRPRQWLLTPLAAQQLEVMGRFFDVLLADFSFASESEAMAVAYIQLDRARARHELGQLSEPRVLELDVVYQEILQRRTASEVGQQLTRSLLAQSLGRAGDAPRDIVAPVLPDLPDPLPELDALLSQGPFSQRVRALAEGRGVSDRALIELELRQQLTELLLRLRVLEAARRRAQVESAWRDLKLDESRVLYEQEVTADLGYSMSQQTRARMLEQRIAYCRALTWAELNALRDLPPWPLQ